MNDGGVRTGVGSGSGCFAMDVAIDSAGVVWVVVPARPGRDWRQG